MEKDAELRALLARRSRSQSVITRHINSLRRLLLDPVDVAIGLVTATRDKLLNAKDSYEEIQDEIMVLCELNRYESHELEESAVTMDTKVTDLLVEIHKWADQKQTSDKQNETERKIQRMEKDHENIKLDLQSTISSLSEERKALKCSASRDRATSSPARTSDRRVTLGTDLSAVGLGGSRYGASDYRYANPPALSMGRGRGRGVRNTSGDSNPPGAMAGGAEATFQEQLMQYSLLNQRSMIATMQAPSVVLGTFDGEPLEYAAFRAAFQELVCEVYDNDRSKLLVLMKHCTGRAAGAIKACAHLPASEGLTAALDILQRKFGSPFLITQAWLQRIMAYPALTTPDVLESFSQDLESCRNSLKSTGSLAELQCTNSMRLILQKLPSYLRVKWRKTHRQALERGDGDMLDQLVTLIKEAAEDCNDPAYGEAVIAGIRNTYQGVNPTSRPVKSAVKEWKKGSVNMVNDHWREGLSDAEQPSDEDEAGGLYAVARGPSCAVCQSSRHFTSRCFKYKEMNPANRLKYVRENKLCLLCLASGHDLSDCPLPWKCQDRDCGKKHHTSLHSAFMEENRKSVTKESVNAGEDVGSESVYLTSSSTCLPLTPVTLYNGDRQVATYALIDSGSTLTLFNKDIKERLRLTPCGRSKVHVNTVTNPSELDGDLVNMEASRSDGGRRYPVRRAMAVDRLPISLEHLARGSSLKQWKHLADLPLYNGSANEVGILIGQNNAHLLEPMGKAKGPGEYDPYGVETRLGWTVFGSLRREDDLESCFFVGTDTIPARLEDNLTEFFKVEDVPRMEMNKDEDRIVLERWDRETRVVDGKLEIPIPLKQEPPEFPDNYIAALRSLQSLGRQLLKNPPRWAKYRTAMGKNFSQGHAEVVTSKTVVNLAYRWFLLHHDVNHPRKPDVSRVVQNGAAKFKGVCLNDLVFKGPDLMNKLFTVLTRFRQFEFASLADIECMFFQIWVPVAQRDCMSFLYWKDGDPNKEVIICRMTRHMFGAVWSPAAANYAIKRMARDFAGDVPPQVKTSIEDELYMDDWLNGEEDEGTAAQRYQDVKKVLGRGSFKLGKLMSNSRGVLSSVEKEARAKELALMDLSSDRLPQCFALGQLWDAESDDFGFGLLKKTGPTTRRGLMSKVASIYDPLGLLTPYVLPGKQLLQMVCKAGSNWDEPIPDHVLPQWNRWVADIGAANALKIPRWLGCTRSTVNRLHHFGDASMNAYGTASYMVARPPEGREAQSGLVAAKSRLAPTRKNRLTIPKLELAAATVAVKMNMALVPSFSVELQQSYFYTDSKIVLYMLDMDPAELDTYSGNRVAFIQKNTTRDQWRFIDGRQNPADYASRGTRPEELVGNDLWLRGPAVIRQQDIQETHVTLEEIQADDLPVRKLKPVFTVAPAALSEGLIKVTDFMARYSQLTRVVRLMAWLLRLKDILLAKKTPGPLLEVSELERAERALAVVAQQRYLKPTQVNSPSFKKLFPQLTDGAWIVGGRVDRADLPYKIKHPFVVPEDSPLAGQLVLDAHQRVGHARIERTLHEIRAGFWILNGRKVIGAVLAKCVPCRRLKAVPVEQMMSDLPERRLRVHQRAFHSAGVDLFGPFYVVVRRTQEKRYGVIFTCMTSRAVYLDLAMDLSTSSFISVLQRFVVRRGKPADLSSDNGTNFVGTRSEVARVEKLVSDPEVQRKLADQGIRWTLNTPAASHQGGAWERMIRSVRSLLMLVMREKRVTHDRLYTALCVVEGILNTRPLTRLSDDPDTLDPLTPAHIMQLNKSVSLFPREFKAESLRRDWEQSQALATNFWDRWIREYLPGLQKRSKWIEPRRNLSVGDLVIVVKEQLHRSEWPLAVVQEVHLGPDGRIRNLTLRTQSGTLRRPVQKVVQLEGDLG